MLVTINDYVLIRPLAEAPQTAGGIVLPKSTTPTIRRGEVISIPREVATEILQRTSIVYFPTMEAQLVTISEELFFLIRSKYIYGVEA